MKVSARYFTGSKLHVTTAGIFVLVTVGVTMSLLTPNYGLFSKFSPNTLITAQNISSNWEGGVDNTYRSTLPSYYISKLDLLTLAILKKGSSMSDAQFKSYLDNLSVGINSLSSKPNYTNDKDIQNILGFLLYEIDSAKTVLGKNINAGETLSDLANVINSTKPSNSSSEQSSSSNSAIQQSTTQLVSSTQPPAPVTPPAPAPVAEKPNSSTKIHGINFRVEGYDLAKSNFEYNFTANTLKSKSLGITFDFSDQSTTEANTFNTLLAAEDHCRSKGRGYRLPKTYELKSLHNLSDTIDSMYYGGNGEKAGFYRVTQTDVNYNIGIVTHYIPDFIPLDILSKISKSEYINNTVVVMAPNGYNHSSNYTNMRSFMKRQYLVKGDDAKYYISQPDSTGLANSDYNGGIMALCVYE